MPYYAEPVTREPNHRGRLRLTTVLGSLPGAVGRGFDGDGTPPKRGRNEEAGHRRMWWFETPLPTPLPVGVVLLPEPAYLAIEATRERTKPLPPPTIPPRFVIQKGLVRATYFERLDSGTGGQITPPNSSRIILDQWDYGIDAILATDFGGVPSGGAGEPASAEPDADPSDVGRDIVSGGGAEARASLASPVDADGDVVVAALDTAGNWAISAEPVAYPIHLIYFAETEIGNYVDDSKLIPEDLL